MNIKNQNNDNDGSTSTFEKVKESFDKWKANLDDSWAEGRYIRAILTFLVPPIAVGLVVVLIIKGISAIVQFLQNNYSQLILAALALWAFAAWWDKHSAEKMNREREAQEIKERQDYTDRLEAARTKEATYIEQAKIVFSVARELGMLGIVPPARLSDIYSPGRTILRANGTVNVSLYLLQKDREAVDTDLLKHTAQTKVDQRLQAGEFPGIAEQYIYRGRVYSGFVIDTVRDSEGYLEVYTAIVNDAYCRYRERRNLSKMSLTSVDRRDVDY